ncbi:hypothetical protein Tco_0908124 [Tanacetum coccineum]|uniref:Aminotransferase-like plant mobile domain-containing protein n=1 Tax=Tanacetum coccineum TaxID=301880 RepID=A0ABQ5CSQ5_9ASTR
MDLRRRSMALHGLPEGHAERHGIELPKGMTLDYRRAWHGLLERHGNGLPEGMVCGLPMCMFEVGEQGIDTEGHICRCARLQVILNSLPPSAAAYLLRGASLLGFFATSGLYFSHPTSQMANHAAKSSIITQEMVDNLCEKFNIPVEVHPTAPGRAVLKYFRIYISQLSPFGAARVSHFEVLTRVLDLAPSVTVFCAFYTRTYSGGLFSFAKRSPTAPSCFPKPPDSIKDWDDHFFWVDSCVFPISVPLYKGGILEKDSAPHLTARQEQTVKTIENHKAPFRRYPECFLCLVGLSPYYPFDDNSYPAFENPDGSDMGLFDFIKTADPRKVHAVEVQKGEEQEQLLESTKHCFMPLVLSAAGGSGLAAAADVPAPTEERREDVRETVQEDVVQEDAYLEVADPNEDMADASQTEVEVVAEPPKKAKKRRLVKQSDVLPAKRLRQDHPSLTSSIGGKTRASLEHIMPEGSHLVVSTVDLSSPETEGFLDSSAPMNLQDSSGAATTTEPRADAGPDLAGPSCLMRSADFLGSEVRSRAEHELELKEKLKAKYDAHGKLLEEKDLEILRLKSQLAEKEAEAAGAVRLRDQVSSLSGEKSALTAEVSALKVTISQKDHDISLLDSRATHLTSTMDDAKTSCTEVGIKITSLASERDRLASEVSALHAGFQEFKEKMEAR